MQARWRAMFTLVSGLLVGVSGAGAESSKVLGQKDAEVRELRRRLEQAEKELEQLRSENERLRRQQEKTAPAATPADVQRADEELRRLREENERLRQQAASGPAGVRGAVVPVRPMAGLPPVTPETVVAVEELVGHYQADPAGAAARYDGKTFRVRGEVGRFHTALFRRQFTVLLVGGERGVSVACRFNYIDRYKTVFTTQNGRVLTARWESGREMPLLELGQTVVIAGRCRGVDAKGTLELSRCELVR